MSAEQNIETAREMYEAFGRGDVQAILDRVTDNVDWSTAAAIPSAPWYGPKPGPASWTALKAIG
jgi:ketosteroid isomerase-like protein